MTIPRETEKITKLREEESILKECSHHPEVNEISKMIVGYKRKDNNFQKVEQFLLNYIDSKTQNLNKAKKERMEQEMKECTFKPKINNSLSEKKEKTRIFNIYEDLYNDHKLFEQRKTDIKSSIEGKLTFQPKINKSYNKLTNDFNFFQRMQIFEEMKKSRLQK